MFFPIREAEDWHTDFPMFNYLFTATSTSIGGVGACWLCMARNARTMTPRPVLFCGFNMCCCVYIGVAEGLHLSTGHWMSRPSPYALAQRPLPSERISSFVALALSYNSTPTLLQCLAVSLLSCYLGLVPSPFKRSAHLPRCQHSFQRKPFSVQLALDLRIQCMADVDARAIVLWFRGS